MDWKRAYTSICASVNNMYAGVIVFKKSFTTIGEEFGVGDGSFPVHSEAVCFGCQWRQDLSSLSAIQDRILRAR